MGLDTIESVDIWEPFLLSSRPTWVAIAVESGKRQNERTLNCNVVICLHACMRNRQTKTCSYYMHTTIKYSKNLINKSTIKQDVYSLSQEGTKTSMTANTRTHADTHTPFVSIQKGTLTQRVCYKSSNYHWHKAWPTVVCWKKLQHHKAKSLCQPPRCCNYMTVTQGTEHSLHALRHQTNKIRTQVNWQYKRK